MRPPGWGAPGLLWSLRTDGALDGATNMARDHAMALGLEDGQAAVRLYGWSPPTVSFGRNEPARGVYDRDGGLARGWSFVRRPTGGRAVLHHREVTYAVVLPLRALGGPRATYRAVNRLLVRGLALLGVDAEIAPDAPGGAASPAAGPCFNLPAPGEVVAGGRKLVGSAQVRLGRTVLQHGSILLEDDQTSLGEIRLGHREEWAREQAPATLAGLLGEAPRLEEVTEALERGFREGVQGSWAEPAEGAMEGEVSLLERYRSEEWTWCR